jgi:hypothetical protein
LEQTWFYTLPFFRSIKYNTNTFYKNKIQNCFYSILEAMLEVVICSVIGVGFIFGGGVLAYYKCFRRRDDVETYVLDMRDSELSITFNEIYNDKTNSVLNSQI